MKRIIIPAMIFVFFTSCAMLEVPEDKKPLSQRAYSRDAAVKETAMAEMESLNLNARRAALLSIASMLCHEKDPDTQVRILKALTELKCQPEAINTVIECALRNSEMKVDSYVKTFLYSGPVPDKTQLVFLTGVLKSGDWRMKEFALTVLGRIGRDAYPAVPDIIEVMKAPGLTFESFSVCFDAIARIHPQTAVDVLVLMMAEQSESVRQNAVQKLLELDRYMSKGVEAMKEVLPAILRALSSGDEKLRGFIRDAVAGIKDPETKKQISSYLEATGTMMGGLVRILGSKVSEKLNEQETRIKQRLKEMYRENGISQRLKDIGVE